jgi:hypothetical protein
MLGDRIPETTSQTFGAVERDRCADRSSKVSRSVSNHADAKFVGEQIQKPRACL